MGRPPCCEESGLKRGPWTPEEDEKLMNYISKHGSGNWRTVPKHAGLNRCGKSCRLRWTNYLRPDIKRGKFTEEEEQLIINLHSVLGNKWSKIATHLPGRTDNEIKNLWNTHIRKKLLQMGIDPETHKPRTDMKHLMNLAQLLGISNNNNLMSPWGNPLLGLQQTDVTQLAQLQLLQNLLQLSNGNSSSVNTGNHHSLMNNPLEAYLNGTNNSSLMKGQELYGNPALFLPPPSDSQQDISKPWTDLEGGSNPQAVAFNNNSCIYSTPSHETNKAENTLPALVSASPGSGTFNQMESISNNTDQMFTHSPSSSIFDAWEKILEDDTSDSCWKELLDLTSTSASPISW